MFKVWYDYATVLTIIVALPPPCFVAATEFCAALTRVVAKFNVVLLILEDFVSGFSREAFVFGVLVFYIIWFKIDPMQRLFFSNIYVLVAELLITGVFGLGFGLLMFIVVDVRSRLGMTISLFREVEVFGAAKKSWGSLGVPIFVVEA